MSATEDLEKKVQSLRDQLREAEEKWEKAMMADFKFQPGDILSRDGEVDRLVSSLTVRYDGVRVIARKKTKSGWHATTSEIWGADRWRTVGRDESALAKLST